MPLPVVALRDSADGQIFIKVRPMKAKGRNLDVIQLLGRAPGKARVLFRWKPERRLRLENDDDVAIEKNR